MKIVICTCIILMALSTCGQIQTNKSSNDNGQKSDSTAKTEAVMSDYHPVFEKAHPKAKQLLQDSFFFSPIEETAPFGSDDGADAYAGFKDWRKRNASQSPVDFVHYQIDYWKYPKFNLEETDFDKLKPYLTKDNSYIHYMTGIDEAIVATAFGQLYLEGKIDADIKALAKTSVKRELLPQLLGRWDKYAKQREQNLQKLLLVLNASGI